MGAMVDVGVFPGNYHDYESDEMAVQRTKEIGWLPVVFTKAT